MINFESLFKISYGIYIVSSGDSSHGSGYISNTFFQVTAEPPCFAASCNKDNYTAELIKKTGFFSVSVLHQNTAADIIGKFGYRSGRDFNKMEGCSLRYGESGVPIVMDDCIAYMECRVIQSFDVGTHLIFIGELIQADIIDDSKEVLTYQHYRQVKKGFAPKNAPTYVDKSKLVKKDKESKRFK